MDHLHQTVCTGGAEPSTVPGSIASTASENSLAKVPVVCTECRAMDAGQFQAASGMAWFYVKYGRGYERLRDIEATARSSKLGLWGDAEPIAPWDWRTRSRELR